MEKMDFQDIHIILFAKISISAVKKITMMGVMAEEVEMVDMEVSPVNY